MGYSSTNSADLGARSAYRASSGTSYAYSASTASKPRHERKVHESLDPKKVNAVGEKIRECLDSTEHPLTIPIFVGFDETGSMGSAPRQIVEKLGTLKGVTLAAGLLDAQLCFGAYGDAQNDEIAPCQVGQFESGLEMEEWLNNLYLEGMGGGNNGETAGLILYFLGWHSKLDSFDKRGKKGYLILTGDELPLPRVTKEEVSRYIDDDLQGDLTIEQVVEEAKKSYDIYFFHYMTGSARVQNSLPTWQRLLGVDHVVPLESLDTVAEQIAMLVARLEGVVDTIDAAAELLLSEGADTDAVRRASKAMSIFDGHAGGTVEHATASGTLPVAGESVGVQRL
jgi:hypothetical protein